MSLQRKTFELKSEHLKLMQRMCVSWDDCEFGAPEIDPKRPYRNSDVYQDVVEILGELKELKNGIWQLKLLGKEYLVKGSDKYNLEIDDEEIQKAIDKIHHEMEMALQVCLSTLSFEVGTYVETDYYSGKYKLVKSRQEGEK